MCLGRGFPFWRGSDCETRINKKVQTAVIQADTSWTTRQIYSEYEYTEGQSQSQFPWPYSKFWRALDWEVAPPQNGATRGSG